MLLESYPQRTIAVAAITSPSLARNALGDLPPTPPTLPPNNQKKFKISREFIKVVGTISSNKKIEQIFLKLAGEKISGPLFVLEKFSKNEIIDFMGR